jgi:hypothetical protein
MTHRSGESFRFHSEQSDGRCPFFAFFAKVVVGYWHRWVDFVVAVVVNWCSQHRCPPLQKRKDGAPSVEINDTEIITVGTCPDQDSM